MLRARQEHARDSFESRTIKAENERETKNETAKALSGELALTGFAAAPTGRMASPAFCVVAALKFVRLEGIQEGQWV